MHVRVRVRCIYSYDYTHLFYLFIIALQYNTHAARHTVKD